MRGAEGDTPVKYVICGFGDKDCFIAARFNSLDSCQRHLTWAGMLCDGESKPGEIVCRKDPRPMSVGYCTL